MSSDTSVDVLIAGGGIAGLVTAVTLAEAGRSVLLVEKAERLGGSTLMSGGTVWAPVSMAWMRRLVPGGDRDRQRQLVEGIEDGLDWLDAHGVEVSDRRRTEERVIAQVDPGKLIERLAAAVNSRGGLIGASTSLRDVEVDGDGTVVGAVVASGQDAWRVRAGAVVLATGGFQASSRLLAHHVPGNTDGLMLRAGTDSTGDGLSIALRLGAATSPDMASFYGHTMPATQTALPPDRWTSVTPYFTQDAVLLDRGGRRFFDESASMADERAPMSLVRRPGAQGVLVFDDSLYRDEPFVGRSAALAGASFDAAVAVGTPHVVASSLAELTDEISDWGVDGEQALDTLQEYNAAVSQGRGATLTPPRCAHPIPVAEPPFRALLVRPAITFTLGGIGVDAQYRVLRDDRRGAIQGLYAIGADAGGTYEGGYAGGLCLGLVQGRNLGSALAGS